jgi:hypothetical protein
MFKRLAKFRLLRSRGMVPGLQDAMPANDNQPGFRRPEGPRRIRPVMLTCRWSLLDGGTRLGCRWRVESPAHPAPADLDSERINNRTSSRQRPDPTVTARAKFSCNGGSVMGAAIESARRRRAIGVFRLASKIPRYARMRQRRLWISHNRLRIVLSGARLPRRLGALLVLTDGEAASKPGRILRMSFFLNPDP